MWPPKLQHAKLRNTVQQHMSIPEVGLHMESVAACGHVMDAWLLTVAKAVVVQVVDVSHVNGVLKHTCRQGRQQGNDTLDKSCMCAHATKGDWHWSQHMRSNGASADAYHQAMCACVCIFTTTVATKTQNSPQWPHSNSISP